LCDYCEQVGHKPDDCHLLSAPKPQLILHGISDEKLMFFECPITNRTGQSWRAQGSDFFRSQAGNSPSPA
jgi:hypothetical protein